MSILDPAFFLTFLPLALLAFYMAGRWGGPFHATLVYGLVSVLFCVPFGWRFVVLTLGSVLLNGLICGALTNPDRPPEQRRWLLRAGVAIDLLVLALFKYLPALTVIPAIRATTPILALWVPITISFYTFQRLVLLVDCYRREPAALALVGRGCSGWHRVLAFTMSFPNLLIGPIAFASEIGPQMLARRFGRLRLLDLEVGLSLFVIGLFKKLVIADIIGTDIVDPIFMRLANGHLPAGPDACAAVLAYYAQLYFDFSGYSDMAVGLARMFGIRMPFNFNSPLRATGIVDFYRRWHITLTRIVARFLFQALSLSGTRLSRRHKWKGIRRSLLDLWLPLLANFLVMGLWHGAAWTFVVFGVAHGTWYIIETEVRSKKAYVRWTKQSSERLRRMLGQAITIIPLSLTFSLFRSSSLVQFGQLLSALTHNWLNFWSLDIQHSIQGKQLADLGCSFAIIWLLPNSIELLGRYRPGIVTFVVPSHTPRLMAFRWRPNPVWGLYIAVLMACIIITCGAPAPFVYGGF